MATKRKSQKFVFLFPYWSVKETTAEPLLLVLPDSVRQKEIMLTNLGAVKKQAGNRKPSLFQLEFLQRIRKRLIPTTRNIFISILSFPLLCLFYWAEFHDCHYHSTQAPAYIVPLTCSPMKIEYYIKNTRPYLYSMLACLWVYQLMCRLCIFSWFHAGKWLNGYHCKIP